MKQQQIRTPMMSPCRCRYRAVARHLQNDRLRDAPLKYDSAAKRRKTTKRIFAPYMNSFATKPKPKTAATRARTTNRIAKRSMVRFSCNRGQAPPEKYR